MNTPRRTARLLALTILALLLFSPPLLGLFDQPAANGLSWLPLYLFLAWAGVILLAAWLLEPGNKEPPNTEPGDKRNREARIHEK